MRWESFKRNLELLGIREKEKSTPYVVVPSLKKARWLLPITNRCDLRTGLLLYSPNTLKGKCYKSFLAILPLFFLKIWQKKSMVYLDFSKSVIFRDNKGDTPGIYIGNEGSDSKPTIQFQSRGIPTSYLKFTKNPKISLLFKQENVALDIMKRATKADIPFVLRNDRIGSVYIFETSSVKSGTGKTEFKFSIVHDYFLRELYTMTMEKNGFTQWHREFKERLGKLSAQDDWMLEWFDSICERIDRNHFPIGRIHGDFTPWNCIIEEGRLKVFDWEYSQSNKPVFVDAIHFILQPIYLKKKPKIREIRKRLRILENYFVAIGCEQYRTEILISIYLLEEYLFYGLRSDFPDKRALLLMKRWKQTLQEIKKGQL